MSIPCKSELSVLSQEATLPTPIDGGPQGLSLPRSP